MDRLEAFVAGAPLIEVTFDDPSLLAAGDSRLTSAERG